MGHAPLCVCQLFLFALPPWCIYVPIQFMESLTYFLAYRLYSQASSFSMPAFMYLLAEAPAEGTRWCHFVFWWIIYFRAVLDLRFSLAEPHCPNLWFWFITFKLEFIKMLAACANRITCHLFWCQISSTRKLTSVISRQLLRTKVFKIMIQN